MYYRALININTLAELFPRMHDALQPSLAFPVPLIQNICLFQGFSIEDQESLILTNENGKV